MTQTLLAEGAVATGSPVANRLARAGAVGVLGFAAVTVAAGFLDPGYSATREGISALGSTESESAWLMIPGFLLLAAGTVAAGWSLLLSLRGKAARTGATFVVLGGLLTGVAGLARQSCSSLEQACLDRESAGDVAASHVVHNLTALVAFVLLVAAGFLLASAARRNARVSTLSRPVRLAAVVMVVFFVWFGSQAYGDAGGIVERVFVVLAYGLPVTLALRAARA